MSGGIGRRKELIEFSTAALLFSNEQSRVYVRETPIPTVCVFFSKQTEIVRYGIDPISLKTASKQ